MSTVDIYIGVAGGAQGIATADQGISIVSASGQAIAGVVSGIGPVGGAIATNPAAAIITGVKISIDSQQAAGISVGDVISVVGNGVSIAGGVAAVVPGGQPLGGALAAIGRMLAISGIGINSIEGVLKQYPELLAGNKDFLRDLNPELFRLFERAKNWLWPRDPIILDLNNNGLETVGLAANIHFDHDSDGVLTKTGWVGKDDALLVWDRNANGTIDTGAELFGDFTPMPDGTLAPNGFAALAALDSNADGIIDASDPAFAELKLWIDADQNGITGTGELVSLADAGIVSLNLTNSLKNQRLNNGNTLAREGSFTRTDGSESAMGEFHLATDTFDSRFADAIEVPEALKALPNMLGAGKVRELQQAAAQSATLAGTLTEFQAATTRNEQQAILDRLLGAWAGTSGMQTLDDRAAGKFRIEYMAFGNTQRSMDQEFFKDINHLDTLNKMSMNWPRNVDNPIFTASFRQTIAEWTQKLLVLEAFNGQYFFNLPETTNQTPSAVNGLIVANTAALAQGYTSVITKTVGFQRTLAVQFSAQQLDLLDQAYNSLRESVYGSLVLQTRLKPYLDAIELIIDSDGIRLDATPMNQMLADKRLTDPENALADLLELDRYAGSFLAGTNWDGLAGFDQMIDTLPNSAGISALLDAFKVRQLTGDDDKAYLTDSADIVLAGMSTSWHCRGGTVCTNDKAWKVAA